MIIGNALGMKLQTGLVDSQNELMREADLLCGDAIVNFKTVQSFGHTDLVVAKYAQLLAPGAKIAQSYQLKTGITFGISQMTQYMVFAAMFWAAGKIIEDNMSITIDEFGNQIPVFGVSPNDVFTALFAIMFGASHMGSAAAFGPDMGKATAAATRIFKMKEHPSSIDAIAMDEEKTKKTLDLKDVKGKIEYRNVWFRYPTRKEDFVLRGLNLTINPGESVALVGESGCGKSTFVNLLMRFYDVDHGEIFIDDINIKDLNLHDLRTAVSLVMQEPIIFNYSILENILYGNTNASNKEVLGVAELSNSLEFINSQ